MTHRWLVPAALLVTLAIATAPAQAATINGNTTTDEVAAGDGKCSLREAIGTVDASPGNGDCGAADAGDNTIALGTGSFGLTRNGTDDTNVNGDLDVTGSTTTLTISGGGPSATTITAAGLLVKDRVLHIVSGPTVTVRDLTITGGHAPDATTAGGSGTGGGGIFTQMALTVMDAVLTGNRAGNAGVGAQGAS